MQHFLFSLAIQDLYTLGLLLAGFVLKTSVTRNKNIIILKNGIEK